MMVYLSISLGVVWRVVSRSGVERLLLVLGGSAKAGAGRDREMRAVVGYSLSPPLVFLLKSPPIPYPPHQSPTATTHSCLA